MSIFSGAKKVKELEAKLDWALRELEAKKLELRIKDEVHTEIIDKVKRFFE